LVVPIDFSYTTSYRPSIVTFALGRTIQPQYITSQTDGRNTKCPAHIVVTGNDVHISVCLSSTPTLNLHSAEGAAVYRDATTTTTHGRRQTHLFPVNPLTPTVAMSPMWVQL